MVFDFINFKSFLYVWGSQILPWLNKVYLSGKMFILKLKSNEGYLDITTHGKGDSKMKNFKKLVVGAMMLCSLLTFTACNRNNEATDNTRDNTTDNTRDNTTDNTTDNTRNNTTNNTTDNNRTTDRNGVADDVEDLGEDIVDDTRNAVDNVTGNDNNNNNVNNNR